ICEKIIPEIENHAADFICLNFANPDMVGHTGVFNAAVKACETVDDCTQRIIQKALENNYTTIIIADHGNCETMINTDCLHNTDHTKKPVPIIIMDDWIKSVKNGILFNIAPTVIHLLDSKKSKIMTENYLI